MATDHATQVLPIQSRSFDIKSNETGERVRVIIEQIDTGTHRSMNPVDLFDVYVEEIETEVDRVDNLDVLEVNHPYAEAAHLINHTPAKKGAHV